jgi:hypothetical protein
MEYPVQSPILFADKLTSTRKPLHIINTDFLDGNDVLVHFSDGTAAVYEAEELEKLRPAAKHGIPAEEPGNPVMYATAS